MIYFAQAEVGGPIKIGYSADVEARLKELEGHYGQRLNLLKTLPGDRAEERRIHKHFAKHRLGKTEQFQPVAEIMQFVGLPLLVGADPQAVEAMEISPTRAKMSAFRLPLETLDFIDAIAMNVEAETGIAPNKTQIISLAVRELAARRLAK